MMKKISKKNSLILILCLLIVIAIYFISVVFLGNKIATKVNNPSSIVLKSKPRLEDDYYDYINYESLKNNNIKEDEYMWYYMYSNSGEKIKNEKKEIIKTILNNCNSYSVDDVKKKICDFYDSYSTHTNEMAKRELDNYINLIVNSKNISEFIKNAYKVDYDLSVDILINPSVSSELLGSSTPKFSLDILSYDYTLKTPSGDYSYYYNDIYTTDQYSQYLNYLKKYDLSILEKYGYDYETANLMVNDVQKMYLDIARFSLKSTAYMDRKGYKTYNIVDVQKKLKNININDILINYRNLCDGQTIMIADFNQLKAIDDYLKEENLETLKSYAIIQILTSYSQYLNEDFYLIELQMQDYLNYYIFKQASNLASKELDNDEYIYSGIYNFFSDTITNEFAQKNFTTQEKEFYTELVKKEIDRFKKNINSEQWLSTETKKYAINKVNSISYTVGIPNEFVFNEKNYNLTSNYINNIIEMNNKKTYQLNYQKLQGNNMYDVDYLEQNAYYMPLDNSINILLGIIYSYKITLNLNPNNLNENYYELLGTIGATIGHELTHSLDSTGSKYDEHGNYIDWWTEEDKSNFEKLTLKVIKYYNKYNEFGNNTLGENIADLGGMKLILQIAEENGATNEDYKKIFSSYAIAWCSQKQSYFIKYLLEDVHSLDKVRTNAVLSSTDKFYEVYNIKPTDKMFVSINDRVAVW